MAVAGDRHAGCDGCGRTVPLEELTAVSMPDGEQVACCPRCEPHAREVARKSGSLDQRRRPCDGCTTDVIEAELENIVLENGTGLSCCPACVADAPSTSTDSNSTTAAADRTKETTSESTADGTDDEESLCLQCNEWVSAELYHVTTIDDRSERLCPDCKARAEDDGIIKDVRIRKTKAREVLGLEAGATESELRAAYHEHVKRAHPDRQSGSKSAFQLVTDAYDRLQDER